jgi:hypothetical protein
MISQRWEKINRRFESAPESIANSSCLIGWKPMFLARLLPLSRCELKTTGGK